MNSHKGKDTPVKLLFQFMKSCKNQEIVSALFALISVLGGIVPYFCTYQIFIHVFAGSLTLELVVQYCAIAFIGFLAKSTCHARSTYIAHVCAYDILKNIRLFLADKLMRMPLGNVQSKNIGSLKTMLVDHAETLELPLAHVIPEGFASVVTPLILFVYLCTVDLRMALISLATLPISFVPFLVGIKKYNKNYQTYMTDSENMNRVIVEYIEGIEVVKAFNQTESSYETYKNATTTFKNTTMEWFKHNWFLRTLTNALSSTTTISVVPLGIYLHVTQGLDPSVILISVLLSMGMVGCFTKIGLFINALKQIEFAMQAVHALVQEDELSQGNKDEEITSYDIEFNKVSFSYSELADQPVLKALSAKFCAEKFTALVGPSGGGKSTIARLIARFWDVTEGCITIGGVDIRHISLKKLSQIVSFVTQDNFLFNMSILENIRVGNPSATDEQVYQAAKAAMCDDFISNLESGYQTTAGEAGSKLSGGERQRIAIARAILKDAPIVILDEATAFADPENEAKLQRSLSELTKNKTLIVIAHRLSTIRRADTILLVERGEIKVAGTHDELLSQEKLYQTMWDMHTRSKNWGVSNKEVRL